MPRKEWYRQTITFDNTRLAQLREAMTAWISAHALTDAVFGAQLVDHFTGNAAIAKLRAAAEGVRTAKSSPDLVKASAELAGGMQSIGLDKWRGFLRDAAQRAEKYKPTQSPVILDDAMSQKTEETSPNAAPAPAASGGYVAENPEQWDGHPIVGNGDGQ
jgi:hypothetical protein